MENSLNLGLCMKSTWTSSEQKGEDDAISACNVASIDSKVPMLIEARHEVLNEGCTDISLDHEEGQNVRLVGLLFKAATAVDKHDLSLAIDILQDIYKGTTLMSDPIQRVVAYFADALAESSFSPESSCCGSMDRKNCPSPEEEFSAFMEFYRALPLYQFAHFTANQEIIEAFQEEETINGGRIHVIDFNESYGLQWPSLIQSLSDMATTTSKTISLTLTVFGRSLKELMTTKDRLESFASSCSNLSFKFEGILRGSSLVSIDVEVNSTRVVNLPFYLHSLRSLQELSDTLASVCSIMNPSLVVLVEKDQQRKGSFLPMFMELLHYYSAIFDSLHEFLPLESIDRRNIEKNYLGKEIKQEVDQAHIKETSEHENSWKETMKGFKFEGKKMSSRSMSQAKLLLKIRSPCAIITGDCAFHVVERDEGHKIALSWRHRELISVSCWRCAR